MNTRTKFILTDLIVVLQYVFSVGCWQIEEIWRSLQNGWAYNLPFGFSTYDYWLAHDFIFVVMWLVFLGQGLLCLWLLWFGVFGSGEDNIKGEGGNA